MGYIYNKAGGYMLLWGRVTRDPVLRTTQKGKYWTSFAMAYDRKHNLDAHMESQYMEIVLWGDDALYVGHDDIGISKGDQVLVGGRLVEDTFYKDGEDRSKKKYKVEAAIVLDMTSVFQVAQMVVEDGLATTVDDASTPKQKNPEQSKFTDVEDEEDDPFLSEEDMDVELPY